MGGGGQSTSSKNPAWLDKAGEDVYNLTRNYVMGGNGGGTTTAAPTSTQPSASTGTTSRSDNGGGLTYFQKMGGLTDPTNSGQPAATSNGGTGFRALEQYGGPRVAGLTGNQGLAIQQARDNQGALDGYFNHANQMIDVANKRYNNPFTANSVSARDVGAERIGADQVGTGRFSEEAASPFMSAYTMDALDPVARKMDINHARDDLARNGKSAMQGAFGGSRTAIENALSGSEHEQNVRDLYATGLDKAFNTGLSGYQTEQDRILRGDTSNQDANLRARTANQSTGLQAALANQAKDVDLGKYNETQRLNAFNANRDQYNTEQGRIASNAGLLGTLAGQQSGVSNDDMNRLLQTGLLGQQYHQNVMDANYNDFVEARDYPQKMLQLLQSTINGSPSAGSITVNQKPSALGQVLGAGTALGSAYLASDSRVKTNVRWIGAKNGINQYEFRYRGSKKRWIGVMAQEVRRKRPDAVKEIDGILHVNYAAIGMSMEAASGLQ